MAKQRLTAALREELSDARILLDTAAHNVQAALTSEEAVAGLGSALTMAEQAATTLRRVQEKLAAR